MTLPSSETRDAVMRGVLKNVDDPVLGRPADLAVAHARLVPPVARVASALANSIPKLGDGDREHHDEAVGHLRFAVEEIATAVMAILQVDVASAGPVDLEDPQAVGELLETADRGFPVWHGQDTVDEALAVWTIDLYQDLNNALGTYGSDWVNANAGPLQLWFAQIAAETDELQSVPATDRLIGETLLRLVGDCAQMAGWIRATRQGNKYQLYR